MAELTRRSFIKLIAAFPLALFAKSLQEPVKSSRRFLLNKFSVAGFQYYSGPALLKDIEPDDELFLKPEPDNQYDDFAVEIFWHGKKIGYVPVSDNKHIFRLLQQGARLECRVLEKQPQKDPWQQLRVEVVQVVRGE